ncbi:6230_t:CDS:1, partial [Acaulospora morrowiae]
IDIRIANTNVKTEDTDIKMEDIEIETEGTCIECKSVKAYKYIQSAVFCFCEHEKAPNSYKNLSEGVNRICG